MESNYKSRVAVNIFKVLNDEQSLHIIGLSLAFNDLNVNYDSLNRYPDNENTYFFSNSISIIRELAHLVIAIDKSDLTQKFSENTKNLFELLKSDLTPFHNESIVRKVLKPIRDFSSHYNFTWPDESGKIKSVLGELRKENNISVGFMSDEKSILGQRYVYADLFRINLINHFLTTETVTKISTIAVNIGAFIDSLIADLAENINRT